MGQVLEKGVETWHLPDDNRRDHMSPARVLPTWQEGQTRCGKYAGIPHGGKTMGEWRVMEWGEWGEWEVSGWRFERRRSNKL